MFFKALFLAFCSLVFVPSAWAVGRTALIIGNAEYNNSPLRNPVNDARDMSDALQSLGFAVIFRANADRRSMRAAIRDFTLSIQKGGVGLFYYAGHGVQVDGINYLLPVGADIKLGYEVPDESVSADYVLRAMEEAGNELNIVILDACRNNPYAGEFRSVGRGLARVNAPTGSLVAYATAPGSVAEDGQGRNGVYTKHLLDALRTPGLDLEDVFKQVRVNVEQETSGRQIPWEESSLRGDFYFIEGEQKLASYSFAPSSTASTAQIEAQEELLFWKGIKGSDKKGDYEEYLRRYPAGLFTALANNRISSLTNERFSRRVTECSRFFETNNLTTGKQGNALDCYRNILKNSPDDPQALAGIEKIENKYIDWTESALQRGDPRKARIYIKHLSRVNPGNSSLPELEQQLEWLERESDTQSTVASTSITGESSPSRAYADGGNSAGLTEDDKVIVYQTEGISGLLSMGKAVGWFTRGWNFERRHKDYGQAAELYKKSARGGYVVAQERLARLYELGLGVPKSRTTAIQWYQFALEQQSKKAWQALRRLGVPTSDTPPQRTHQQLY
ncbi:caspase family protein [Pseudomonadota bacterium]